MVKQAMMTISADKWRELSNQYATLSSQLADAKAENERLKHGLIYISHHYGRFDSESQVTHFAWCIVKEGMNTLQALKEATDETPTAREKDLRARLKEYVDLAMDLRKKLHIETGEPKWQRYTDSLWEQINRVTNPEEYEEVDHEVPMH